MTEIKSNMTVLCQNNHRKNSKLKKKQKTKAWMVYRKMILKEQLKEEESSLGV